MAKMISPKEFKIRINLATILKLLKNEKECEENLKVAEENIVPGQEEQAKRLIQEVRDGKGPILI
jgi:signal transduction histidine kinase